MSMRSLYEYEYMYTSGQKNRSNVFWPENYVHIISFLSPAFERFGSRLRFDVLRAFSFNSCEESTHGAKTFHTITM